MTTVSRSTRSLALLAALALAACGGGAGAPASSSGIGSGAGLPVVTTPGSNLPGVTVGPCPQAAPKTTADDWTTYAHDLMHTGCEAQNTGITTSNVSKLKLKWKYNAGDAIFASPLVVNGVVYIVTDDTGIVTALSAKTGKVKWQLKVGGGEQLVWMTPTYDPATGLLYVGTHGDHVESSGYPKPLTSYLFAIDTVTGKAKWKLTNIPGVIRGAPAIVGNNIYVGLAGGDPPFCVQGGIWAYNKLNGAFVWKWVVDALPRDGGSVWAPIAYDGTNLIAGTGNTCTKSPLTANGIVAISPASGDLQWSINTAGPTSDYDVGGGTLVVNNMAITEPKSGIVYFQDEATGGILHSYDLKVVISGFATPVSDGTTVVVGGTNYSSTGSAAEDAKKADDDNWHPNDLIRHPMTLYPIECEANEGGRLIALDMQGQLKWQHTTSCQVLNAAAINNGIVYADLDGTIFALNLQTGKVLWNYVAPNRILASPAIVPDGLFTADTNGNVYAFGI